MLGAARDSHATEGVGTGRPGAATPRTDRAPRLCTVQSLLTGTLPLRHWPGHATHLAVGVCREAQAPSPGLSGLRPDSEKLPGRLSSSAIRVSDSRVLQKFAARAWFL